MIHPKIVIVAAFAASGLFALIMQSGFVGLLSIGVLATATVFYNTWYKNNKGL